MFLAHNFTFFWDFVLNCFCGSNNDKQREGEEPKSLLKAPPCTEEREWLVATTTIPALRAAEPETE
jgi:hypothetical protein